jgi:hypothetical protein
LARLVVDPLVAGVAGARKNVTMNATGRPVDGDCSGLACQHHELDAVAQVQLLQDVHNVCLHGGLADEEPPADFRVRQAVRDQPEHVLLACGEVGEPGQ